MRRSLALVVIMPALAASFLGCMVAGCPAEEPEGKRVGGTDGRERWIVIFDGPEPDLAEYRGLLDAKPDDAKAYAESMREKLRTEHAEFEASLASLNATVVERWWMSNAVTIEIDATRVPSLKKARGVKTVQPDVPLNP